MATVSDQRPDAAAQPVTGVFTWVVYTTQFFFGGWFLAHGLNYWLGFFPQPHGSSPLSHELIMALIDTGLFAFVKAVEVLTGLLMLLDIFVPLAIVLAVPVAISIAHLNIVANNDLFARSTGFIIMALIGILGLGYLDRYLPMLKMRNHPPGSAGLRALFGKSAD